MREKERKAFIEEEELMDLNEDWTLTEDQGDFKRTLRLLTWANQ